MNWQTVTCRLVQGEEKNIAFLLLTGTKLPVIFLPRLYKRIFLKYRANNENNHPHSVISEPLLVNSWVIQDYLKLTTGKSSPKIKQDLAALRIINFSLFARTLIGGLLLLNP